MVRDRDDTARGGVRGAAARQERLAASLRENLRRRKAQERARTQQAGRGADSGDGGNQDAKPREA